ncbi:Uncharacterised protein [uncultured archaeon]|nr:Uncharacterised protein [uncultured archaeon]
MYWEKLTSAERKLIKEPSDFPIISLIKSLSCLERNVIYNSIRIKEEHQEEYKKMQEPWVDDFKELWGENHKRNPDEYPAEFSTDFLESGEYERYRLYYSARNPQNIEIIKVNPITSEFLAKAIETISIVSILFDNYSPNSK